MSEISSSVPFPEHNQCTGSDNTTQVLFTTIDAAKTTVFLKMWESRIGLLI